MEPKYNIGEKVILKTYKENYFGRVFPKDKEYKITGIRIQYLIEDEEGYPTYVDEEDITNMTNAYILTKK